MEIDDKIYQEAIEVLRIKLRNTSAEMAFVENHSHQPDWYLHGMMRGLEIGYTIIIGAMVIGISKCDLKKKKEP